MKDHGSSPGRAGATAKLDVERTVALIREVAGRGECCGYDAVAHASGAEWGDVFLVVQDHLMSVLRLASARGWPMITAVIVNKKNAASGLMEPKTLAGFTACARALGAQVEDAAAYLREQQEATFRWAGALGRSGA